MITKTTEFFKEHPFISLFSLDVLVILATFLKLTVGGVL